jgi:hypothetical protein
MFLCIFYVWQHLLLVAAAAAAAAAMTLWFVSLGFLCFLASFALPLVTRHLVLVATSFVMDEVSTWTTTTLDACITNVWKMLLECASWIT